VGVSNTNDYKQIKQEKNKFYSDDGDSIINPDVWKGNFLDQEPKQLCINKDKNNNVCPTILNKPWTEYLSYENMK